MQVFHLPEKKIRGARHFRRVLRAEGNGEEGEEEESDDGSMSNLDVDQQQSDHAPDGMGRADPMLLMMMMQQNMQAGNMQPSDEENRVV